MKRERFTGERNGVLQMTYRIWLTEAAKATFVTTQEKKYGEMKEITRFSGHEVSFETGTGSPYVQLWGDPIDPTLELPTFPKGKVKKVTFLSKYHVEFRNDGIYRHKGAVARVEMNRRLHTPMTNGDTTHLEEYQEIQISAGSIRTLREIYTKVRSGTLKPSEDWGAVSKAPTLEDVLGMFALAGAQANGVGSPGNMN
jgi:hypothetical protein